MKTCDVIVLGAGGVGSAAAMHLARRGASVVALERYSAGHDRGSSHGQTRIIRQAYFEHLDYVPLLRRAYALWRELEEARGEKLLHLVGLLEIGPSQGVVIPGVLRAAREHDLQVDQLTAQESNQRFPGFVIPTGYGVVFEQEAGYLLVERCVLAHLAEARRFGAELHFDEPAVNWSAEKGTVHVTTERETYSAARMVVAGGPWASSLLAGAVSHKLEVVRKHLHWYAGGARLYRAEQGCPAFFYELPHGCFYGFPQIDEQGVKVAEHSGGEIVSDPSGVCREPDDIDRRRVEQFLSEYLPAAGARPAAHAVCMYTRTADEHFLVGRHPRHEQIAFAAGLSGHGFKFTGVLGEILADLSLGGETMHSIELFSPDRPW